MAYYTKQEIEQLCAEARKELDEMIARGSIPPSAIRAIEDIIERAPRYRYEKPGTESWSLADEQRHELFEAAWRFIDADPIDADSAKITVS